SGLIEYASQQASEHETAGRDNGAARLRIEQFPHYFIASSMCSMRVKTTGPSAVTSTFSSSRAVCSRYGCPANVSIAKYMFSLIGAGYFIEYARDIHMPS